MVLNAPCFSVQNSLGQGQLAKGGTADAAGGQSSLSAVLPRQRQDAKGWGIPGKPGSSAIFSKPAPWHL